MIDRAALNCRDGGADAQTHIGPISRVSRLRVVLQIAVARPALIVGLPGEGLRKLAGSSSETHKRLKHLGRSSMKVAILAGGMELVSLRKRTSARKH